MKKVILIVCLVLLIAGLLVGCDDSAAKRVFSSSPTYIVSFESNGGSEVASQMVFTGEKAATPTAPTRDGYVFEKWYSDSELTAEFDFNTPVTANIILWAKWNPATYTITYKDKDNKDFSGNFRTAYPTTHTYGTETPLVTPTSNCNFGGWYIDADCTGTSLTSLAPTSYTANITLYANWTEGSCLAAGTVITMADGSRQAVETLKIGDMIKTFNHETGLVSSAPICSFWAIEECYGNFVMHFSNEVSVSVVQEHCFFDMETNRYEVISYQNASEYIGHSFYNADKDRWEKLISVDFYNEPVTAYYVFTAKHYNHVAEGMLSLDTLDEKSLTYVFDFGEKLKFDEAKMLADIQKYGLMTIEEMPYVPQAYFDAVNMKYLKIAYGKGLADREDVEKQIRYYISQMNL